MDKPDARPKSIIRTCAIEIAAWWPQLNGELSVLAKNDDNLHLFFLSTALWLD